MRPTDGEDGLPEGRSLKNEQMFAGKRKREREDVLLFVRTPAIHQHEATITDDEGKHVRNKS